MSYKTGFANVSSNNSQNLFPVGDTLRKQKPFRTMSSGNWHFLMSQREPTPSVTYPHANFEPSLVSVQQSLYFSTGSCKQRAKYTAFLRKGRENCFPIQLSSKELIQDGPETEWYLRKPNLVKQTHFLPVSRITRPLPLRRVGVGDKRRGCSHNLP